MQFGDDERAAAIQVGAVLLFGILIISMAMYQATVVPDQNKGVEFNHNQRVQGQMQDLRNTVVSVPSGGGGGSVTVDLGTTYPSRSLFVNPGPPYGSLRTVGTNEERVNVTIENANATNEEVRDFWDGSARAFETGAIAYSPNYHEYENPPETVYEHSLLYNQFRNANLTITDQSLVNGDEITLVALDGNLSENGMSAASVTAHPVSASTNTVTVRNESVPINVTVATRLDRSTWEDALADQRVSEGGHVEGIHYESSPVEGYSLLTIQLEPNVRYDLRTAKVGVGSGTSGETGELYLADVDGGGTVQTGGTQEITVEVRDRYNNPVGNETVNFSADRGSVDESSVTTDGDGRATVTYTAPDSEGEDTVTADISASLDDSKRVSFEMTVESSGGGGDGGTYDLAWNKTQIESDNAGSVDCDSSGCTVDSDASGVLLTVGTSPAVTGATVDYALDDPDGIATINASEGETDDGGESAITFDSSDTGGVDIHANSAGGGDVLSLDVITDGPYFDVTVQSTNSPVVQGEDLETTVEVENAGGSYDEQTIELDFDADGTVDASERLGLNSGESTQTTLVHNTYDEQPGDYTVRVSSENDTASTTVTVEPSTGKVEGTVTDTDDNPIEGANVTVDGSSVEATTDSSGYYLLEGVESGEQHITADADGFSSQTKTVDVPPQGDPTTEDYTLSGNTGALEGFVTDSDTGDAVEDATITVDSTGQTATTNASGGYRITDVPDGSQDVTTDADGYLATTDSVSVTADATTRHDVVLQPRVVNGTVTDAGTGDPISGATVYLDDGSTNESATTDADGNYAFTTVEPADYTVTANADGYDAESTTVSVAESDATVTQDFRLQAQPGSLSGQVTYSETGDPIAGATVTIEETGQETTTDTNGEYKFDTVDRGTYNVTADHPDYVAKTREVTISPGEDAIKNFALPDTEGSIFGVVRDSNSGNALENADVTVYEAGTTNVVTSTTTDANGEYDVVVQGGAEYDVVANGSEIGYNTKETTNVAVAENEDVRVDFDLEPVTLFGASNDWTNNDDLYTEFTVSNTDDPDHNFVVDIDYTGNRYDAKQVTIDGDTYTLTANAADAVTSGQERDLLDAGNYENVDQATLNGYRNNIDENSAITNEVESGSASLDVRTGPKN